MHIVIDGYNLIGSVNGLRGNLEAQRRHLLSQLQQYEATKGHTVTVVFDGWRSGWVNEVKETHERVNVIYSRQGEKADDVVARLAREMESGCVVVSSDREVRRAAEAVGAVAVYAGGFSARLRGIESGILFKEEDRAEFSDSAPKEKRGNPRRLSKTERKRRERLKKL